MGHSGEGPLNGMEGVHVEDAGVWEQTGGVASAIEKTENMSESVLRDVL